ncbi:MULTISPECIES: thioredoxin family protein [Halorussus]|uniref:thioredoxin family protein n=1 Tax=Halorussus TaxID=1070314 RepID=UPI00209CC158|nr:thioredoxin family protein [Halorussus vallis]USZ74848.1 thioredoxin family protein [Halorussus vallis]
MTDPATTETAEAVEAAETPEKPVDLADADELDEFIAAHDRALVEFHTQGCSLCQAIQPVLGNVARATDVAVGTMNPRDDPPLVEAYDVRSVPTLLLFEDGELVDRLAEGFQGTEAVVAFVEGRGRSGD